jgi:hypothetical protein
MRPPQPPALATWLLNQLPLVENHESLIGDLVEQYQGGRSVAWFWRQTVGVVVVHVVTSLWSNRWLVLGVTALSAVLSDLYLALVSHWVAVVELAWYPALMKWLAETQGNTVRHAVYGLTTGLTAQVAWCVLSASVAWVFVRLRPDARRLVVALLVLFQVGPSLPGLLFGWAGSFHNPANLIGFLRAFRFALFVMVAVPLSIWWGARAQSDPH